MNSCCGNRNDECCRESECRIKEVEFVHLPSEFMTQDEIKDFLIYKAFAMDSDDFFQKNESLSLKFNKAIQFSRKRILESDPSFSIDGKDHVFYSGKRETHMVVLLREE